MKSRKDFETEQEYKQYLRTQFAMAAMQGILSNPDWRFSEGWAAGPAVQEADELLKQLES